MVYGSRYEVYGAGVCVRCGRAHPAASQIPETQQSRFKLMQFLAEMSTAMAGTPEDYVVGRTVGPFRPPIIDAGAGQKFMVGLLLAGGQTLVSVSGNNLANGAFTAAVTRKRYVVCGARKAPVGVHNSVVDRVIPAGQYMATQGAGASPAGDCAAPRLIERAFELIPAGPLRDPSTWAMSEVFYQPKTSRRTADDLHWVHGLSAHSCATCQNLVPLLLCPLA